MTSYTPRPRLRDYSVGDKVKLPNDNRDFVIREILGNGYVELTHKVTASDGHEVAK